MFDIRKMVVVIGIAGCVVGGVGVGTVLFVAPHVWAWIKPLLHAATA